MNGNKYIMRLDRGQLHHSRILQPGYGQTDGILSCRRITKITILTATSGDTGGAIANAFHGLRNIKAVILYPASEVTDFQRKQMTTLKDNISAIALNGNSTIVSFL